MEAKKPLRITTHEQAKEEERERFLKLTVKERLMELQGLRILNYGKDAFKHFERKLTVIKKG